MNQNEILKKIVEYWKLNHKKYCVKVPKELTIGTVNDWILDSYEKFYNKNDEFNIGISIWREYDKIFEYILGNKCLYYTHSYYDEIDYDGDEDLTYNTIKIYYGDDSDKHHSGSDICLVFDQFTGYDQEPTVCLHVIITSIMLYEYYKNII